MKRVPNGMLEVDRLLREQGVMRADECWVHGMWLPSVWWQCVTALARGRKLVRMTHGALSPVYLTARGKWRKRLVSPIERWLFARCDRIVVTGEWEVEWARRWGVVGPFEVIDLKRFFRLPDGSTPPPDAVHSPLRVLYLGRRHPLKGDRWLDPAVEGLAVELRVVSDAFDEARERAYDWCDVLVLPTMSENFALVVAEALERGKRVIVSDGAPAWADCGDYGKRLARIDGFVAADDAGRIERLRSAIAALLADRTV